MSNFAIWPGKKTIGLIGATSLIAVFLALAPSKLSIQEQLIIATIATLQTVLMMALIVSQRHRIKKFSLGNLAIFLIALAGIGATRGATIYLTTMVIAPEVSVSLQTRVFNSVVTICAWGLVFSVLESRLISYKEEYRQLFANRAMKIALVEKRSPSELAKDIDNLATLQALQANLGKIAQDIEDNQVLPSQLLAASTKIRREIEQSLRPLSQRMWFDSNAAEPRFRLWELLKESLRNFKLPWHRTAALNTLAFLLGSLSIFGVQEALLRCVTFGFTLALLLALTSKLRDRIPRSAPLGLAMIMGIALVSHLVGELSVAVFLNNNLLSYNPFALAIAVATIGALVAEATLIQMRRDWNLVNVSMADPDTLLGPGALEKRLAGFLHNTVKSQLEGIALGLEKITQHESGQVDLLLGRLRFISNTSLGSQFTAVSGAAFERLTKIVDSWQGISRINLAVKDPLENHPKLELATELVEEAISNAVRHSRAESIDVTLSEEGEDIIVLISHFSTSKGKARAKIGQLWLERFSKQYSITHDRAGLRTLRVTL